MVAIERFVLYLLSALAFLSSVGLAIAVLITGMNSVIAAFLICQCLLFSPITFYAYWRDKSKAKRGTWRTPEVWLHVLELGGGWIVAFLAQRILKHKSKKKTYQQTYIAIAVYHLSLWINFIAFQDRFGWICFFFYMAASYSLRY